MNSLQRLQMRSVSIQGRSRRITPNKPPVTAILKRGVAVTTTLLENGGEPFEIHEFAKHNRIGSFFDLPHKTEVEIPQKED